MTQQSRSFDIVGAGKQDILILLAPLFQGVCAKATEWLQTKGQMQQWRRHQHLFLTGSSGTNLQVLLTGRLRDYYIDSSGTEHLRSIIMPGDIFPLAILTQKNYTHNSCCQALMASLSFEIPLTSFLESSTKHPGLAINLAQAAARQLERTCRDCCLCRRKQARGRVAGYLLSRLNRKWKGYCHDPKVNLRPLTATAEELGLARETFSRLLMEFERQNLVVNNRGIVNIIDAEALLAIAVADDSL